MFNTTECISVLYFILDIWWNWRGRGLQNQTININVYIFLKYSTLLIYIWESNRTFVFSVTLSKTSFGGFCLTCRLKNGNIYLSSIECDANAIGYCGRLSYSFVHQLFKANPTQSILESTIFVDQLLKRGMVESSSFERERESERESCIFLIRASNHCNKIHVYIWIWKKKIR